MAHPLERQILMIQESDLKVIEEKDSTYKGSWHKRGGIGAFMMLARKWDRLEQIAKANGYDIFKVIAELDKYSHAEGGLYAEIGDLRRYLLLVEAFMANQREDELRVDKHYGYEVISNPMSSEKVTARLAPAHTTGFRKDQTMIDKVCELPTVSDQCYDRIGMPPIPTVSACPESVGLGAPVHDMGKLMDAVFDKAEDIVCSSCFCRWLTDYSFCPACGTRLHNSPQRETS